MQLQMLAMEDYCRTNESDPIQCYRMPLIGRQYRNRVTRCIELLPESRRVLEIGYGSGVSFLNLGGKFDEIHGLDLHDRADDVARSFGGRPLNLCLRQGNILGMPFEDESFGAAMAISVHEHLRPEQQCTALTEVHRVLRPGGCYVVGVPGLNAMMTVAFGLMGVAIHEHHLSSEKQVLAAMREVFDVDVVHFRPRLWPRSLTSYVCMRGWKR